MRSAGLVGLTMFAVVAAGCSQSEPMSLPAYADSITEVTESYVLESQEISLRYQTAVERQVEALASSGGTGDLEEAMVIVRSETANFLAFLDDAMGRYQASLAEMEPPLDLADPHDAYLSIITSVRSTLPASRDALAETTTFDEVIASLVGSGFADGQQAWTATCETLESEIRAAGMGADLKCSRDPVSG